MNKGLHHFTGSFEVNQTPRKTFKEDEQNFRASVNQKVPDLKEEDSVMLTNSISRKHSKKRSGKLPTIEQYRDLRKDLINFNTSDEANERMSQRGKDHLSKKQLL